MDAVTAMIEIFIGFTMPFRSQKFASNLPAKSGLKAHLKHNSEIKEKFVMF
jgi:hypothetical protein